jgi:hypothetical protein
VKLRRLVRHNHDSTVKPQKTQSERAWGVELRLFCGSPTVNLVNGRYMPGLRAVVLWRHEIGHLRRPPPALVRCRSLSTRFGIRERWAVEDSWMVDEDAISMVVGLDPFDAGMP